MSTYKRAEEAAERFLCPNCGCNRGRPGAVRPPPHVKHLTDDELRKRGFVVASAWVQCSHCGYHDEVLP